MSGRYPDWTASAEAWIALQGEDGDDSRKHILDPALASLIGDVRGLRVLDVGSGQGRYVGKLARHDAEAFGVEPVARLAEHAARTFGPRFALGDGSALPFRTGAFDLVISYLTILDIPDYRAAAKEMVRVCRPGGRIAVVTVSNMASTTDGWQKDSEGNRLYRTVDRYMEEFTLHLAWGGLQIDNYHRPLSSLLRPFFESGAVLTALEEPLPPPGSAWHADESRCPSFQIILFNKMLPHYRR